MRWEYNIALQGAGVVIVLFLGIIFSEALIPFQISPIHIFGFMILAILSYSIIGMELMRGFSPPFESEAVYCSINDIEIEKVPWSDPLVSNNEKPMLMAFIPLGGINFWSFNPKSPPDKPFVIQPYEDLQKTGKGYRTVTNLIPYDLKDLPPEIRHFGIKTFGRRIMKCPIYYGTTSHVDGSVNSHNERILFEQTRENRQVAQMETQLDWTNQQLERTQRSKEKIIHVQPMGTTNEEP